MSAQCDARFPALYKYSYLLAYLLNKTDNSRTTRFIGND